MAKTTKLVSQAYTQIATGPVVITVSKKGEGVLYFNETPSDVSAYKDAAKPNDQFQQSQSVNTFCRADGDGWEIIVDGTL